MAEIRPTSSKARRAAGYGVATLAGGLVAWLLLLFVTYVNRPYVAGGRAVAQCVGLGRLGWIGPLLIAAVVGGLAFYLAAAGNGPPEGLDDSGARCLVCGNAIHAAWKICPYCGSLVGKTRHPGGTPDDNEA